MTTFVSPTKGKFYKLRQRAFWPQFRSFRTFRCRLR